MTHCFYKDADFCLVIFDITNRESFLACAKWKKDLDDKYMLKSGKSCPCLLIGNKVYHISEMNTKSCIKLNTNSFFIVRSSKSSFRPIGNS